MQLIGDPEDRAATKHLSGICVRFAHSILVSASISTPLSSDLLAIMRRSGQGRGPDNLEVLVIRIELAEMDNRGRGYDGREDAGGGVGVTMRWGEPVTEL